MLRIAFMFTCCASLAVYLLNAVLFLKLVQNICLDILDWFKPGPRTTPNKVTWVRIKHSISSNFRPILLKLNWNVCVFDLQVGVLVMWGPVTRSSLFFFNISILTLLHKWQYWKCRTKLMQILWYCK